jgi:hypothetical protein
VGHCFSCNWLRDLLQQEAFLSISFFEGFKGCKQLFLTLPIFPSTRAQDGVALPKKMPLKTILKFDHATLLEIRCVRGITTHFQASPLTMLLAAQAATFCFYNESQ